MSKLSENKEAKRQRLLETSFTLFTTKGITKTSIADIVERAGVAKGTFYLYFRDKYDLQEKLISHKTQQMLKHALTCSHYEEKTQLGDKLIAIIDDILEQMQKRPELLRFINKNLSWGLFSRALDRAPNDVPLTIQSVISPEEMPWQEAKIMLFTIIEMVGATCHSVILESNPIPLAQYKPYLYQSVQAIVSSFGQTKKKP